jgi:hypothetical protein
MFHVLSISFFAQTSCQCGTNMLSFQYGLEKMVLLWKVDFQNVDSQNVNFQNFNLQNIDSQNVDL